MQLDGPSVEVAVGFMHPESVIGADGERSTEDVAPRAAIETLATNPRVDAGPITTRSIDGREAFEIELRTERGAELFGADGGTFAPEPGRHRFLAFEVDGALLVILELIHHQPHAEAERLSEDVVDSVLLRSA
jgi:hypothetical protein